MDKIITYIILALIGYILAVIFTKLFAYYAKIYLDRAQKKREEKRKEKLKWKYCEVNPDNPLLNRMMNDRTIIFMGARGKGKSKMMNLVAHFLWKKRLKKDKKKRRYNKYKKPEYLVKNQKLESQGFLPIYSNYEYKDYETGLVNNSLKEFFEMDKEAIEGAIYCIDEVSSLYGKDYFNNTEATAEEKKNVKENVKKNRHFTNGWILGTEQDGDDIFKGIRENGYALVNCLETRVHLAHKGKYIRCFLNCWNLFMPGLITTNLRVLFREKLFFSDKLILFCKLLLPTYFLQPELYYTRRENIFNKINRKYQYFETNFTYRAEEHWIRYTHEDIFDDNTRAHKKEYDNLFDENGDRIVDKKEETSNT